MKEFAFHSLPVQIPYLAKFCITGFRPSQVLSFNQIAGFFDHQYLWKECANVFDFLHGDIHQRKVTWYKAIIFDQMYLGVPSHVQTCPDSPGVPLGSSGGIIRNDSESKIN